MKKCPNCGAQLKDNSLFCTECGKPIPHDNLGGEKKSSFKKYLPYIIGAFVLLMIIGYFSTNGSSKADTNGENESVLISGTAEPASIEKKEGKDYTDADIKDLVEKMYKELFAYGGYRDFDEKYTSAEYKSLCEKAQSVADGPFLDADHWTNSQDFDEPSVQSISAKKDADNKATATVTIKLFKDQKDVNEVKLVFIYEGGKWVVDDFLTYYEGKELSEKAYLKQFIKDAQ